MTTSCPVLSCPLFPTGRNPKHIQPRYRPSCIFGILHVHRGTADDVITCFFSSSDIPIPSIKYYLGACVVPRKQLFVSTQTGAIFYLSAHPGIICDCVHLVRCASFVATGNAGALAGAGAGCCCCSCHTLLLLPLLLQIGLLRLGFITQFLSHAIIGGFISGNAIVIGLGQVSLSVGWSTAGR